MDITTILYRAAVTITTVAAATLAGAGLASAAVSHPAEVTRPAHVRALPRWAHWKTAPRGACRQDRGIVVWAGHGDGVLICSDGDTETS